MDPWSRQSDDWRSHPEVWNQDKRKILVVCPYVDSFTSSSGLRTWIIENVRRWDRRGQDILRPDTTHHTSPTGDRGLGLYEPSPTGWAGPYTSRRLIRPRCDLTFKVFPSLNQTLHRGLGLGHGPVCLESSLETIYSLSPDTRHTRRQTTVRTQEGQPNVDTGVVGRSMKVSRSRKDLFFNIYIYKI